jgi:hypothetical protein
MKNIMLYLSVIVPFITGTFLGEFFPIDDTVKQKEYVNIILTFAQSEIFNVLAPLSVVLFAIYVFVFGQIDLNISKVRKALLYALPSFSYGCVMPFYISIFGFLLTYNGSIDTMKLAVFSVFGFVYSVGFFTLMLLPAHEGIYPKSVKAKRKLYGLLVVSFVLLTIYEQFK